MKTIISMVFILGSIACVGQQLDTLTVFDPKNMNSEGRDFLQINNDEISFYSSQGYISLKKDDSIWTWKNSPEKTIFCKNEVKILKYTENGIVKSLCLACIENNRILKVDACIEIKK
jgi:hypothetical protein